MIHPGDIEQAMATPIAPAVERQTRPLYWSIRRELWENRSIYVAPLIVACVAFVGFLLSTVGLAARRAAHLALGDAAKTRAGILMPYDVIAMMLMFTGLIVSVFYCLDALYGERKDRSILFWKSLPLSDRTTVLSKIAVPLIILPAINFVIIVCLHLLMLMHTSFVLVVHGMNPSSTFEYYNVFSRELILLYALVVMALWHAPIYAWFLLVSSWAKRAVFLWAFLPWMALGILEQVTTGRSIFFRGMMESRFCGGIEAACIFPGGQSNMRQVGLFSIRTFSDLRPLNFLTSPGLWGGLIVAALFLAAAVRLRRAREPI